MPDDLDIYRSTKLLIDQHGEDAPIFAAMQGRQANGGGRYRRLRGLEAGYPGNQRAS